FPLAVRIFARDESDAAPASARVYSWNTVGAIVGATAAAFFLIPMLKYEGAIRVAVIVNVALAAGATVLIGKRRTAVMTVTALALVAVVVAYRPAMPEAMLRTSPVMEEGNGEIRFYEVGRSATVLVLEESGFFNLRTNGLPEASTNLIGAPPYQHNQRLLSALPVLARPDVEEMLIVGFGAGATLEGVPPSVKRIDVIELEPVVIDANRSISKERQIDPLADPRVNIYINDARSALTLTAKKYDAIVSQPSHPWTAGASHLYTREFMSLANDHLTDNGVYLQWMSTQFVDEELLKSLCATMLDVFDNVRVYQWNPTVLFFLGSAAPLNVEVDMATSGRPLSDDRLHYLQKGVGSVEDAVVALTMDHENIVAFATGADIITDDFNLMATRSAVAMGRGRTISMKELGELLTPFDPLLQPDSFLHQDFPIDLDFGYVSRRLEGVYLKARAIALADTLLDLRNPESLVMIGLGQQRQGDVQESQRSLLLAIGADPDDQQAKYALLRPWLTRLGRGEAPPEKIRETLMALRGSAATTIKAWLAASQNNYQEVANLDRDLAAVSTTDLWYKDAVKLRVDWRIKVTTEGMQPRLAREATALIDEAIALYQDPDFYTMRLASSFVADDAPEIIETARRLIYIFDREIELVEEGQLNPEPQALRTKLLQVDAVQTILAGTENDDRIPAYKRDGLATSIEQVSARLQALSEM
ncbi:MAG: spermidine synthase, partial [Woeseiaceae bacterium]